MSTTVFIVILSSIIIISSPMNLICHYKKDSDWWIAKDVYQCDIKSILFIKLQEESLVDSISGNHFLNHNNDDVKALAIKNKIVNYFPTKIDKFFKNLELIDVSHNNLKEVHQGDIKPFPKLRGIVLHHNDIEVLENGLFDYNLKLEMVWLNQNKLVHIDVNVFDNLDKLSYLSFESNPCISMKAENSLTEVKQIIEKLKEKCQIELIKTLLETNKNLKEKKDCDVWKPVRFIICIVSGAMNSLIVLLSLIFFYRTDR